MGKRTDQTHFFLYLSVFLFLSSGAIMAVMPACIHQKTPEPEAARSASPPDLSKLNDGVYHGTHEAEGILFAVDILVESHAIREITVTKGTERIYTNKCALCKATEMIKDAIETQSLEVDAYSGATPMTKALWKAVENALTARPEVEDGASGPVKQTR